MAGLLLRENGAGFQGSSVPVQVGKTGKVRRVAGNSCWFTSILVSERRPGLGERPSPWQGLEHTLQTQPCHHQLYDLCI